MSPFILLILPALLLTPSDSMKHWPFSEKDHSNQYLACYQCREEEGYVGDACRVVTKLTPRVTKKTRVCYEHHYDGHSSYWYEILGCVFGTTVSYNNGPVTVIRIMQSPCSAWTRNAYSHGDGNNYACADSLNRDMPYCYYCQTNLCNTGYDKRYTKVDDYVAWNFMDPDYYVDKTGPIWVEGKNQTTSRTVLIDGKDMESMWNRVMANIKKGTQWMGIAV